MRQSEFEKIREKEYGTIGDGEMAVRTCTETLEILIRDLQKTSPYAVNEISWLMAAKNYCDSFEFKPERTKK